MKPALLLAASMAPASAAPVHHDEVVSGGVSAAIAAHTALHNRTTVWNLPYESLRPALEKAGIALRTKSAKTP